MPNRCLLLLAMLALVSCASTTTPRFSLGDAPARVSQPETTEELPAAAEAPWKPAPEPSLAAGLQAPGMMDKRPERAPPQRGKTRWAPGHAALQGFLGAYELETVERTGGSTPPVDGSDDSLSRLPAIGGGAQWKLGGQRIDLGLEAMISFGWRANAAAFAVGGGGAVVAVDVDMFLIDLYGGPFVSLFLGERWRIYGALGPMLEWASFDQDSADSDYNGSGSGFGTGWYSRAGLEFAVRPGLMIGAGARWSDSTIDLDSGLGDLDIEGLQWAFTVTTGI